MPNYKIRIDLNEQQNSNIKVHGIDIYLQAPSVLMAAQHAFDKMNVAYGIDESQVTRAIEIEEKKENQPIKEENPFPKSHRYG